MPRVTDILRHPLKSHGREALQRVTLSQGAAMPWDRHWAVAHEASKADGSEWAACANFSRVSKAPLLMAITARLNEADESLTLSHPNHKDFTFQPDDERQLSGFLAWVKPLMPADRAQSARILRLPERGFTDSDFPSISINSHASLRALSEHIGQPLSQHRWRGNLWIDGLDPWVEHSWLEQKFRIGSVVFEGVEPIERCMATTANPDTGLRDADTLSALNALCGHQDFGLYARVIEPGTLSLDDTLELL